MTHTTPRLAPRLACLSLFTAAVASAQTAAPDANPGAPAAATAAPAPAAAASTPQASPAAPAAATRPPASQRIEITGGRSSDDEARRRSTAAKIVIGREEIEKFGDATVGEVLRRLPGVTTPGAPGRGGPPRMRGLGSGFTQLLLDGQRVPPGFSLESLTPEQIERIEILRAPTAETGARAIAGTINIITREGFRRRLNDLRLGFGYESGQVTPGLHWTHNDSTDALTYNISAAVFRPRRETSGSTVSTVLDPATGDVVESQQEDSLTQERRRGLHLTSRLQWRLGEQGDMLVLMPSVFHGEGGSQRESTVTRGIVVPFGQASELPTYERSSTGSTGHNTSARLNLQWRQRVMASRLELSGMLGQFESAGHSVREAFTGASRQVFEDTSATRDRSASLSAKLSTLLGGRADGQGEHSLVLGAELESNRRSDSRIASIDGVQQQSDFDENLSASSLRTAFYAQDEWAIDRHWAVHAGLRWEGIVTRGEAADGTQPENRSSVTTPLLHVLWKPDPAKRDQVRLSLTRSYRAPSLSTLIGRLNFNTRIAPPALNTELTPDSAGNPNLKPELARGLDLAFERYLEGGGVLSANLFYRRIANVMRRLPALETVTWNGQSIQRWVARQQNVGDAQTQGIELEAKFRLDQAVADAPRVELRSNLSLYRSRVDGVPGPDNRLDNQAKATANLGADYRLRSLPLTLGGNVNVVPGYRTQLDEREAVTVTRKRVFDAYALWTFNPAVALRLLASNLAPLDYTSTTVFSDPLHLSQAAATSASATNWQLRLELKL